MIRETIEGLDQLRVYARENVRVVKETKSAENIFSNRIISDNFRAEANKIQLEANQLADRNRGGNVFTRGLRKMRLRTIALMLAAGTAATTLAAGVASVVGGDAEPGPQEQVFYGDNGGGEWAFTASNLDTPVRRRRRSKPSYFNHAL